MMQIYPCHQGLNNRFRYRGYDIFHPCAHIAVAHQAFGFHQVGYNEVFIHFRYRVTRGTGRKVVLQDDGHTHRFYSGKTFFLDISVGLSINSYQIEVSQSSQEKILGVDVVDLLVAYPVPREFSFVNRRECFITAQYRAICARPKTHRAGRSIVPSRFLTHTSCIDRAYHTVAAHHIECQRERCSIPRDDCPIVTRRRSVDPFEGRQSQFVLLIIGGSFVRKSSQEERANAKTAIDKIIFFIVTILF